MKNLWNEHKDVVQGIMITFGVVVVLAGLFIISENTGDRSNDKTANKQQETTQTNSLLEEGQVLDEERMKPTESISMDDFKSLIKKKTTTVVMLAQDGCYWCQQQKPILESLMYEYNLDVKYLDVNKITEEEYDYLVGLHEDLENFGTPTFISIQNKKVRLVSENAKNRTGLVKMFADMGIIE